MKKLLMTVMLGITFVSVADEKTFDLGTWDSFKDEAWAQAKKEFAKEFVMEGWRCDWEAGKGICFFDSQRSRLRKYDSDGRLIKVAPRKSFPEIMRFDARVSELESTKKKQYAESFGVTIEELEKIISTIRPSLPSRGTSALRARRQQRETEKAAVAAAQAEEMRKREDERVARAAEEACVRNNAAIQEEIHKVREARQKNDAKSISNIP